MSLLERLENAKRKAATRRAINALSKSQLSRIVAGLPLKSEKKYLDADELEKIANIPTEEFLAAVEDPDLSYEYLAKRYGKSKEEIKRMLKEAEGGEEEEEETETAG